MQLLMLAAAKMKEVNAGFGRDSDAAVEGGAGSDDGESEGVMMMMTNLCWQTSLLILQPCCAKFPLCNYYFSEWNIFIIVSDCWMI